MTLWGRGFEPGDLIVLRDGAPLGRRSSTIDRLGIVVAADGGGEVIPGATTLGRALKSASAPLAFRPSWKSRGARDGFVDWFDALFERSYQAWRTPRLVFRLMLKHSLKAAMPLTRVSVERAAFDGCRIRVLPLDRQGRELIELASAGGPRRPVPPRPPHGSPDPRSSSLSLA